MTTISDCAALCFDVHGIHGNLHRSLLTFTCALSVTVEQNVHVRATRILPVSRPLDRHGVRRRRDALRAHRARDARGDAPPLDEPARGRLRVPAPEEAAAPRREVAQHHGVEGRLGGQGDRPGARDGRQVAGEQVQPVGPRRGRRIAGVREQGEARRRQVRHAR